MTQKAIDMAEKAKIHPFEYLLSVVCDKSAAKKDRLNAAQAALPYCLTRLSSTEINVNTDLSEQSKEDIVNRLLSVNNQLAELGFNVINGESRRIANGSVQTVNGSGTADD
jgi:hypothetical protein